jgi:glycosyltransferase involved in cell wall biosynthesis
MPEVPSAPTKKPNILAVLPSMLPSAQIYTIKPLSKLAEQNLVSFEYTFESRVTLPDLRSRDLVVFVRNDDSHYSFLLDEARTHAVTTIYDLDDNLWELPKDNPASKHHPPEKIAQISEYLRTVDYVKVYNPILYERIKTEFNRNAFLALAGIDIHLAPERPVVRQDDKVRIVYATGRGANDELYPLILADIERLLEDYEDKVEFVAWRDCPETLKRFSNVQIVPFERDYEAFIRSLASSGYDIGLAPLRDDVFYLSKTNTKFRDYGISRIAGVYSDNAVYQDVQDGVTGLLVRQEPGAWYQAVSRLVENKEMCESIQEAAYQHVAAHYCQEKMEEEWSQFLSRIKWQKPERLPDNTPRVWQLSYADKPARAVEFRVEDGSIVLRDSTLPENFGTQACSAPSPGNKFNRPFINCRCAGSCSRSIRIHAGCLSCLQTWRAGLCGVQV